MMNTKAAPDQQNNGMVANRRGTFAIFMEQFGDNSLLDRTTGDLSNIITEERASSTEEKIMDVFESRQDTVLIKQLKDTSNPREYTALLCEKIKNLKSKHLELTSKDAHAFRLHPPEAQNLPGSNEVGSVDLNPRDSQRHHQRAQTNAKKSNVIQRSGGELKHKCTHKKPASQNKDEIQRVGMSDKEECVLTSREVEKKTKQTDPPLNVKKCLKKKFLDSERMISGPAQCSYVNNSKENRLPSEGASGVSKRNPFGRTLNLYHSRDSSRRKEKAEDVEGLS